MMGGGVPRGEVTEVSQVVDAFAYPSIETVKAVFSVAERGGDYVLVLVRGASIHLLLALPGQG